MRPAQGIATDASHSMKESRTECQGVDLETGETLFRRNLGNQTVNIGEFLGVVEAVKLIIETGFQPAVVYTDSTTAIAWFNAKRAASSKQNNELLKAEVYLRAMAAEVDKVEVRHWDNKRWGETPADFHRK